MILTIWFGKLLRLATKIHGGGGSALPGYWIERLRPSFLKQSLDKLPHGVIIVTGTNGKTTTTKIISDLMMGQDLRVLTNRSGGNFVRGIISTIIEHIGWSGRLPYDIAVFEQDEAYAVRFVKQYQPRGVVALNVGRDQLDRFGEIDKTAALIGEVVAAAKQFVVLNTNDPRIASLAPKTKHLEPKVYWFGHDEKLSADFVIDDQHHTEQPQFYQAAEPFTKLVKVVGGQISLTINDEPYKFKTALDGNQNALNLTAALATLLAAEPDASLDLAAETLAVAQPAFGRGETITLKNGGQLKLQLIKNPSSFKHNLKDLENYQTIGIAINDDYADGRDVSWLWDVDFKDLTNVEAEVVCGGSRAYDMAVRLKYDEVKSSMTIRDPEAFLKSVTRENQESIIFCTYTAMLHLRKLLKPLAITMSEEGL